MPTSTIPLPSPSSASHAAGSTMTRSASSANVNGLDEHGRTLSTASSGIVHDDIYYPCSADGYDILAEIGVGAFATVYRGVIKDTNHEVAIKVIDLDQFNTNWDEIRREILIMSLLHHPDVVKIHCSFVDGQDLWIVMPLLRAGSCAAIMKQIAPNGFKDETLVATILKYSLEGLEYLHKDGRIHRDLKAGNILIGEHGEVQLADFGVAGTLLENGDRKRNRCTFTGTPCWMAPEVMEHTSSGYDEKADIWSFGITAMELGYGRAPYAKFQPMKVMLLTLQEEPPTAELYKDHSYEFSRHFHSMISKCLRKDPKKRPNAKKLLEHKFFKKAKDCAYIVEKIVSKLPRPEHLEKVHVCREKTLIDMQKTQKSKPVSVGSWVFSKEEFEQFKKQSMEEKASNGGPCPCVTTSVRAPQSPQSDSPPSTPHAHDEDGTAPSFYDQTTERVHEHVHEHVHEPHQEGRFLVSDENSTSEILEDDGTRPSLAEIANAFQDLNPSETTYSQENNNTTGSNSASGTGFPVFHDGTDHMHTVPDSYDPDLHFPPSELVEDPAAEHHSQHIGRFSICDE